MEIRTFYKLLPFIKWGGIIWFFIDPFITYFVDSSMFLTKLVPCWLAVIIIYFLFTEIQKGLKDKFPN